MAGTIVCLSSFLFSKNGLVRTIRKVTQAAIKAHNVKTSFITSHPPQDYTYHSTSGASYSLVSPHDQGH
jgi:hypothetical protein